MSPRHFTPETARAANARREERRRAQFDRDLRGDHDGPASYAALCAKEDDEFSPPLTTPSIAEILSWED